MKKTQNTLSSGQIYKKPKKPKKNTGLDFFLNPGFFQPCLGAVDGVRVSAGGEGGPLDGGPLVVAVVPQHDLAAVGAAQNEVGMEAGEHRRHHRGLTVEDELGSLLQATATPV